jgi:hypothetical protein
MKALPTFEKDLKRNRFIEMMQAATSKDDENKD